MGVAASQGRKMFLTQRKSDIEFKVQVINQRRTTLAEQASQLARAFANQMYQNDDPTVITGPAAALPGLIAPAPISGLGAVPQAPIAQGSYEIQMTRVQALDKELELRSVDLQTQNKEVESELEAVQKVIDKAIERGFKTLG
jgi:chaperonin cofactor prefoldin